MREKLFYCCFLLFPLGGLLWLQLSRSRQDGGFMGQLGRWDSPTSWGHMGWLAFLGCWGCSGGLAVAPVQLCRWSWLGCWGTTQPEVHQLLLKGHNEAVLGTWGALHLCLGVGRVGSSYGIVAIDECRAGERRRMFCVLAVNLACMLWWQELTLECLLWCLDYIIKGLGPHFVIPVIW